MLFFSLEMAAQQLSARILSEQTEIEMWKIRNGRFSESEWEKFVLTMQDLSTLPLYIDDTGGISIAQIAARARRLKREKNIGLIIIDYLQLVEPSRRQENRVQEITEVTKGLKTLAKELNVPVLALSQLSRGVDARDDKRPVLSDLRESGSIEQDADVVMFVYREEYYLKSREPDPCSRRSRQMAGEMRARPPPRRSAGGKTPPRRHQQDRSVFRRPLHPLQQSGGGELAVHSARTAPGRWPVARSVPAELEVVAEADQFAPGIGEIEFPQTHPPAFDVGFLADKILLPRHRRQELPRPEPGEDLRIVGIEQKMIHRQVEARDGNQQFRPPCARGYKPPPRYGASACRASRKPRPISVKSDKQHAWPGGP